MIEKQQTGPERNREPSPSQTIESREAPQAIDQVISNEVQSLTAGFVLLTRRLEAGLQPSEIVTQSRDSAEQATDNALEQLHEKLQGIRVADRLAIETSLEQMQTLDPDDPHFLARMTALIDIASSAFQHLRQVHHEAMPLQQEAEKNSTAYSREYEQAQIQLSSHEEIVVHDNQLTATQRSLGRLESSPLRWFKKKEIAQLKSEIDTLQAKLKSTRQEKFRQLPLNPRNIKEQWRNEQEWLQEKEANLVGITIAQSQTFFRKQLEQARLTIEPVPTNETTVQILSEAITAQLNEKLPNELDDQSRDRVITVFKQHFESPSAAAALPQDLPYQGELVVYRYMRHFTRDLLEQTCQGVQTLRQSAANLLRRQLLVEQYEGFSDIIRRISTAHLRGPSRYVEVQPLLNDIAGLTAPNQTPQRQLNDISSQSWAVIQEHAERLDLTVEEIACLDRSIALTKVRQLWRTRQEPNDLELPVSQLLEHNTPEAQLALTVCRFIPRLNTGLEATDRTKDPYLDYLKQLSENDRSNLRSTYPDPVAAALETIYHEVLADPETYEDSQIPNPEYVSLHDTLRSDEEFLAYVGQELQTFNSQRDWYGHFYFHSEMPIYPTRGDFIAQQGAFYAPEAMLKYFAEKHGYDPRVVDEYVLENPSYKRINRALVPIAMHQLTSPDTATRKSALNFIWRLRNEPEMLDFAQEALSVAMHQGTIDQYTERLLKDLIRSHFATTTLIPQLIQECHTLPYHSQQLLKDHLIEILTEYNRYHQQQSPETTAALASLLEVSPEQLSKLLALFRKYNGDLDSRLLPPTTHKDWQELAQLVASDPLLQLVDYSCRRESRQVLTLSDFRTLHTLLQAGSSEQIVAAFDEGYATVPNFSLEIALRYAKELQDYPIEKWITYLTVIFAIRNSPSQEIQKISGSLIREILATDDPVAAYEKVSQIFIRNNLPLVGKIYNIFVTLHGKGDLSRTLNERHSSPVLYQQHNRERHYTIYRDLLTVHLESGNRSLREYLELLRDNQQLIDRAEAVGIAALSSDEQQRLQKFTRITQTLFEESQLGRFTVAPALPPTVDEIQGYIQELRVSLRARPDQSLSDRLAELYIKPIGETTIDGALERIQSCKVAAHSRNVTMANAAMEKDYALTLNAGDLVKGVNADYISQILQNGSVAKEYLGADATSDATPLDTDVSRILERPSDQSFSEVYDGLEAARYGQLALVIKDRGQFQETQPGQPATYQPGKYELFRTGIASADHYGIRTGFPATEIDFIVAQEKFMVQPQQLQKLFFEIARNGYYIPICGSNGNLIFTPETYQRYRQTLQGLERFDGEALVASPIPENGSVKHEIEQLTTELAADREQIKTIYGQVTTLIRDVLTEEGITLKEKFDRSIIGAELIDTGSTSRLTNKAGDYDFDLILKLDATDLAKRDRIVEKLMERLKASEDKSHVEPDRNYYQLRAIGARGITGQPLDIDIGISPKAEVANYGSHDAAKEKLAYIRQHQGEVVHDQVIANIVLAKKLLGEAKVYKTPDGGFGGIGVENWILAHNGSLVEAFQAFWQAAHVNDKVIDIHQFRSRYHILDPGINTKTLGHNNFISILRDTAYTGILKVIDEYAQTHDIKLRG